MTTHAKRIAWYLWPFAALWKLLAVIVEMTGRLVAMILGIALMIVGVLVSRAGSPRPTMQSFPMANRACAAGTEFGWEKTRGISAREESA
jgi:hypothetical protein